MKYFFILLAFCLLCITVNCHLAQAQLIDQMIGGSIGAGTELGAASLPPAPTDDIVQRLQKMGYSDISLQPQTLNQFSATSTEGMKVLLTTEPRTGQLINAMPQ